MLLKYVNDKAGALKQICTKYIVDIKVITHLDMVDLKYKNEVCKTTFLQGVDRIFGGAKEWGAF